MLVVASMLGVSTLILTSAEACSFTVNQHGANHLRVSYNANGCRGNIRTSGIRTRVCLKKSGVSGRACSSGGSRKLSPNLSGSAFFTGLIKNTKYKVQVQYRTRTRWRNLRKQKIWTHPGPSGNGPGGSATCKTQDYTGPLSSSRVRKKRAEKDARGSWQRNARGAFGTKWSSWYRANDRTYLCSRKNRRSKWRCRARAKPCRP